MKKISDSKNSTQKEKFYLPIINALNESTNLTSIKNKLGLTKQKLNYYLRKLVKRGFIIHKDKGWYEVVKGSKTLTMYGNLLSKDFIRGHAFVWEIKIPKIENWNNRIEILKQKQIHFNLVGALKNIPRIKVLGRKVWLCNNNIRIFDKKNESYYAQTSIDSHKLALNTISLIISALEKKLGVLLKPNDIYFRKEHYAMIKNDLAIECNRNGEIIRISDENGEWLIIDDSLEQGGELETTGKSALKTNTELQKYWNDMKRTKFQLTPTFLMESINKVTENQLMFATNIEKHMKVLEDMSKTLKKIRESLKNDNTKT